jgi:hypothetical protein
VHADAQNAECGAGVVSGRGTQDGCAHAGRGVCGVDDTHVHTQRTASTRARSRVQRSSAAAAGVQHAAPAALLPAPSAARAPSSVVMTAVYCSSSSSSSSTTNDDPPSCALRLLKLPLHFLTGPPFFESAAAFSSALRATPNHATSALQLPRRCRDAASARVACACAVCVHDDAKSCSSDECDVRARATRLFFAASSRCALMRVSRARSACASSVLPCVSHACDEAGRSAQSHVRACVRAGERTACVSFQCRSSARIFSIASLRARAVCHVSSRTKRVHTRNAHALHQP